MISLVIFILVAVIPFIIYLAGQINTLREDRGIAAGIPKPRQAKAPREPRRKPRDARVRQRRTTYCGRGFTHFALALVGSQDSCRYCGYLQEVPPPPPSDDDSDERPDESRDNDTDAAIRAAEEIIDRANQ